MTQIKNFPKGLTAILIIVSWMTYRMLGFIFMPSVEAFGGDLLPTAWVIPLGQDALIGLTAPLIAYLIATKPKILTYAIVVAWVWWGIADFGVGLATEYFQPPFKSPFGSHTPSLMMTGWLLTNLSLEVYALYLLLTPDVRQYFMTQDKAASLSIAESPMKGRWILVVMGAALMAVFFQTMTKMIDAAFAMMGF
ncbi:MAG: hypothetical protein QNL04_01415 [SAR324 cluster bacterium]|nr:hypothetical protein [SAR324 cluster bacterium]